MDMNNLNSLGGGVTKKWIFDISRLIELSHSHEKVVDVHGAGTALAVATVAEHLLDARLHVQLGGQRLRGAKKIAPGD